MNNRTERNKMPGQDTGIYDFTLRKVVQRIGMERILKSNSSSLRMRINDILEDTPRACLRDLESHGLFDGEITPLGMRFIRELAEKHSDLAPTLSENGE